MSMLRQSAAYLPARVIPGALNFLGLILYARLLGPADFGHLTLVVGVSTVINASALYWVRQSYLRASAEVSDDRAYRATALWLNAAIMVLLGLLGLATVMLGLYTWIEAIAVVMLVGVQNACEVRQEFLRAHERVSAYGIMALIRAITVLPVALLLLHFTQLGFLAPVLGLIAGGLAGSFYAQLVDQQSLRGYFTPVLLRSYFIFGLPLIPFFVIQALLSNVDRFQLNYFLGIYVAGSYAAGYDAVQQSVGMMFISISLAGLPLIYKAYAQDGEVWRTRAEEYGGLLLIVVIPLALLLTLYQQDVINLLLGEAYGAASVTLPFVAWAAVLSGIRNNYFNVAFLLRKKTLFQLPSAGLALMLNVGLNIALIPKLGILGAGIASISAQTAALALSVLLSIREVTMPFPGRAMAQVSVAGILMVFMALILTKAPFIVSALLASVTYVVVIVGFRWSVLSKRLSK